MLKWFVIIIVFISGSLKAEISLPSIGQQSAYLLKKENDVGRQFFNKLKKTKKIINDPLVNFYINEITLTLLQGLEYKVRDYQVSVIKENAINAFAVPGGYIGLYSGLILATKTQAQLAGVLAHEISHISLQHRLQMLEKQESLSNTALASFFLALALTQYSENADNGDLVNAVLMTGTASGYQSMINFTRENEYEADRMGLRLMHESNYPLVGMAEFFALLEDDVGSSELSSIEYLRTHPVSANRMGEAYQISNSKNKHRLFEPDEYDFFKVYLNYITNARYTDVSGDTDVLIFERALADLKHGQYQQAEKLLTELYQSNKDNLWISHVLVEVKLKQNKTKSALLLMSDVVQIYPEHEFLQIKKINILIALKQNEQALNGVLELLKENKENKSLHYLLVEIYRNLGLELKSKEAEADYLVLTKQYRQAVLTYDNLLKATSDGDWIKILQNKKQQAKDLREYKAD